MKKLKILLAFNLFLGFAGTSSLAQALMAAPESLENIVNYCGPSSVWCDGTLKGLTENVSAEGWKVVDLTFECNILKGPDDKSFVHPLFNQSSPWVKSEPGLQTVQVRMLDFRSSEAMQQIAKIPEVGATGTFAITGPSAKGISGFCFMSNNGLFLESTENGKSVLQNGDRNRDLKLKTLPLNETQETNGNAKAVETIKNLPEGTPVPRNEFNQTVKMLIERRRSELSKTQKIDNHAPSEDKTSETPQPTEELKNNGNGINSPSNGEAPKVEPDSKGSPENIQEPGNENPPPTKDKGEPIENDDAAEKALNGQKQAS